MSRSTPAASFLLALGCLALMPNIAGAQSAIAGVVRDSSGAILPAVTVEASSEALIEKTRTAVSDGQGQYRIIDLRPGTYVVTFTLTGFQTFKRDNLELPSEFTATVNAEMRVGAVEETITVTSAAPTVDVRSASHVQVIDREALDNLPTGRTIQGIGQIVVGINLNLPDVGGSRAAMQTYMSVHGQSAANNTVMVDGMMMNGLETNGQVQGYFNDAMNQEMTYQTAAIGADVSGGGVRLNMIPKDGGNRFSGSAGMAFRPGSLQGNNLTPRLQTAGVAAGNSTKYISDFTAGEGGPLMKDTLWFFATGRDYRTSNRIPNTFFDNGKQGDDYNYVRDALVRLTWQATARHKFSVYYDRVSKYRGHDMQSNFDPETAASVWTSPNYSTGSVKWSAPLTSRLMFEAGYAFNVELRNVDYQPGVDQPRGTEGWYAGASRTQTGVALGVRTTAATSATKEWPRRSSYNAAAAYVTGSHTFKVGLNGTSGSFYHAVRANGDLTQQFSDAALTIAQSVIIRNTPVQSQELLELDMGVYAMDTWTMKRLTINAGLRNEWLRSGLAAFSTPAGRFVPARSAPARTDLPKWRDLAPRFQAVYDLFGNAKTAVKFSVNRYNAAQTTSVAASFNPLASRTSPAVPWTDLNGDRIAQGQRTWNAEGTVFTDCVYLTPGCELQLSQLAANFGLLSDAGTYGGFPRSWNLETGIEVQHELMPRVSVTATWFRGDYHDLTTTVNRAVTPADYTPVEIFNPIDGAPITIYNISAAANGRASDNLTSLDPSKKDIYDSFSAEFRARLGRGASMFGGVSFERERFVNCTVGKQQNPNYLQFCDQTHLPKGQQIPYAANVRMNALYPLPWWGVMVSGTFQGNDGGARPLTYAVVRSGTTITRYPDGSTAYLGSGVALPACPAPCTAGGTLPNLTSASFGTETAPAGTTPANVGAGSQLPLAPWGSVRYERLYQLDLKVSKTFRFRGVSVLPSLEAFNINNSDKVITVASNSYAISGGAFLRPNSILQGRIIGVSVQTRW